MMSLKTKSFGSEGALNAGLMVAVAITVASIQKIGVTFLI